MGRGDTSQSPFHRDERGKKPGNGFVKAAGILVGQELGKCRQPPGRVLVYESSDRFLTYFGLHLGIRPSVLNRQPLQVKQLSQELALDGDVVGPVRIGRRRL